MRRLSLLCIGDLLLLAVALGLCLLRTSTCSRSFGFPPRPFRLESSLESESEDEEESVLGASKEYRYTKEGRAVPEEKCLYWVLWVLWVLWLLARGKFKFPGIIHWVTRLTIVISLLCFELEQFRDHFSQPTWGSSGTKVASDLL